MIVECILLGIIGGFFLSKRKRTCLENLNFSGLWISFIGAMVFYLSLNLSLRSNSSFGDFLLKNFFFIHPIALFLMGGGMFMGKKHVGKFLVGFGFIFNGIAVLLNQKMPVSAKALNKISDFETLRLLKENRVLTHTLMNNTKGNILGDIIAYKPIIGKAKVMSIGDVVIALGIAVIIASYISLMSRRG